MAIITELMLDNTTKSALILADCPGHWNPDGWYVFSCGLQLSMEFANTNCHFWAGALQQAHQNHHDHDSWRLRQWWNLVETVECEGASASIKFYCDCEEVCNVSENG